MLMTPVGEVVKSRHLSLPLGYYLTSRRVPVNLKGWVDVFALSPPPDRLHSAVFRLTIAGHGENRRRRPQNNPCYKHGLQRQRRQRESNGS